jgi:hypothetical protein
MREITMQSLIMECTIRTLRKKRKQRLQIKAAKLHSRLIAVLIKMVKEMMSTG